MRMPKWPLIEQHKEQPDQSGSARFVAALQWTTNFGLRCRGFFGRYDIAIL